MSCSWEDCQKCDWTECTAFFRDKEEPVEPNENEDGDIECAVCGYELYSFQKDLIGECNYCPNCGARWRV